MPTAEVASWCREEGLLEPGDRVLVAASGGADSTALVSILVEARDHGLPLEVVLAHVDHGWRGAEEARADREAVEALARRLGVPLDLGPGPPPGPRTEDAARRWRYRCLADAARRHGCRKVATGHHLGDQAETFLLRLLRGSGPVGLAGIPARRPLDGGRLTVVRPLLRTPPEDLREHLRSRGLGWREDATNRDLSRDRNAARARLRALEARGAAATRRLADLAERLGARLRAHAAALEARLGGDLVHHAAAQAVSVAREDLDGLGLADLDLALRRLGAPLHADRDGPWFARRHLRRVQALLRAGGALHLPRGLVLRVARERVWLARRRPDQGAPPPRLACETVPAQGFDLPAFLRARAAGTAAVDAERLGPAPHVRPVATEDRFVPFGSAPVGEVGVLEWLQRRGVPAILRRGVHVVEGDHGVAWVVGHRIDARHAVGPGTRRVALLRVTPDA